MTLQEFLAGRRVPFAEGGTHRHVRDGWLGLDCPWCGTAGKFHLGVHLATRRATCWRCGRHDLRDALLRLVPGLRAREVGELLRNLPRPPRTASEGLRPRGRLDIPSPLEPLSAAHRGYLEGRGLDPDELERLWGLRSVGLSAHLAWRIWIPVHLDGEVASWTTRTTGTRTRRYVNADPSQEVWPIKSLLYGWDYVRSAAVVVEGPADAWRVGPGAVALFGVNPTLAQLDRLRLVPRRVICFDNEPAAQRAAAGLCDQLRCFPGETLQVQIESDDPGSATSEEVAELRSWLE